MGRSTRKRKGALVHHGSDSPGCIGGHFTESQALGAAKPRQPSPGGATAVKTIGRKWDAGSMRPIDADGEDDWSREDDNLGRATP